MHTKIHVYNITFIERGGHVFVEGIIFEFDNIH